ncbi:hypothetical protein PGB90_007340 [Kerria lacca]
MRETRFSEFFNMAAKLTSEEWPAIEKVENKSECPDIRAFAERKSLHLNSSVIRFLNIHRENGKRKNSKGCRKSNFNI